MLTQTQPLIEVFAEIPDFRRCRGKRHPLPAILSLACCAMLCGYRTYSAIAEWGRNYGAEMAHALGFRHHTPCAATLHTIFRHIDRDAVEAVLADLHIDVLINNAGVMPPLGNFADMKISDIYATLEVNLSAAVLLTRLVVPQMR